MPKGQKAIVDKDVLIRTIQQIKNGKNPPQNTTELYKAVGATMGVSASTIINRVRDYGIEDIITTQPTHPTTPQTLPAPSSEKTLDLSPFSRRGIEVVTLGDLMTSSLRTPEENRLRREAWTEIRRKEGLPKPEEGYV